MNNTRQRDDGYAKRRLFDLRTIQILLMALIGTGGTTGIISYLTDPNIRIQSKVNEHEIKIVDLNKEVELRTMRMENYVKSHNEKEELRQQLNDKEFEHIKELLLEIRADLRLIEKYLKKP